MYGASKSLILSVAEAATAALRRPPGPLQHITRLPWILREAAVVGQQRGRFARCSPPATRSARRSLGVRKALIRMEGSGRSGPSWSGVPGARSPIRPRPDQPPVPEAGQANTPQMANAVGSPATCRYDGVAGRGNDARDGQLDRLWAAGVQGDVQDSAIGQGRASETSLLLSRPRAAGRSLVVRTSYAARVPYRTETAGREHRTPVSAGPEEGQ